MSVLIFYSVYAIVHLRLKHPTESTNKGAPMGISIKDYEDLGYVEFDELAVPDNHPSASDQAKAFFAGIGEDSYELLVA